MQHKVKILVSVLFLWVVFSVTKSIEHTATLNRIGYCEKLGRILTDDEKIKSAINYIENDVDSFSESATGGKKFDYKDIKILKYKSADEVLQKNPGCCKIIHRNFSFNSHQPDADYFDFVFGSFADWINISYDIHYLYKGQNKILHTNRNIGVDICGRADVD